MYRFELFRDASRQYRFRLVSANGEIVMQSEAYTRKAKAKQTIVSICKALFADMPVIVDLTKQKP